MEVRPLTVADAAPAGTVLAARHQRERAVFPLLAPALEDPAAAAEMVASVLRFSHGTGAFEGDELLGFLTCFEQTADPSSPMARYLAERAQVYLSMGHAVTATADPARVYPALFAVLAEEALAQGVTDHVAHVPIGDPVTEAAWVALGFGRQSAVCVRDLSPVDGPAAEGVEIRLATPDELDIVDELVDEESIFHAGSPIFRPYMRGQTRDAVRAELARDLASARHAFFVARHDHRDVGILCVTPGFGYLPEAVYIATTAVVPGVRRLGIGAALTDAALTWARERDYTTASLHFATANPVSRSFWTGLGFQPVMVHLRRRLDERILTHRPAGRMLGTQRTSSSVIEAVPPPG